MNENQEYVLELWHRGCRIAICPRCDGGKSEERSLSVFQSADDRAVIGKCHRASCGALIVCDQAVAPEVRPPPAFVPKPLTEPYRLLRDGDYWSAEYIRLRRDGTYTTAPAESGLRVIVSNPLVSVWRLRGMDGTHRGHITRTRDKSVRTFKDVDRPLYYSNAACARRCAGSLRSLYLFEDCMSAALCPSPAIALLGTSISAQLCDEIKAVRPGQVLVCLDPGAEDAALKVYERLVATGLNATYVPMNEDFKDMTEPARRSLLEAYS